MSTVHEVLQKAKYAKKVPNGKGGYRYIYDRESHQQTGQGVFDHGSSEGRSRNRANAALGNAASHVFSASHHAGEGHENHAKAHAWLTQQQRRIHHGSDEEVAAAHKELRNVHGKVRELYGDDAAHNAKKDMRRFKRKQSQ